MSLQRRWNWPRRWWTSPPAISVSPEVQPVAIVDDVRALTLPPRLQRNTASGIATAVVGRYPLLVLGPGNLRPVRLISLRISAPATGMYAKVHSPSWVGSINPITTMFVETAAWSAIQPGGYPITTESMCLLGTNPNDSLGGYQAPEILANIDYGRDQGLDVVIGPDEIFFLQGLNQNTTLNVKHVIWEEIDTTWGQEHAQQTTR